MHVPAWSNTGPVGALVFASCIIAGCRAGSDGDRVPSGPGTGSAGSAAATLPPRPPPRVTCADLPGATRSDLQLSRDGKTLYYVEDEAKQVDDERVVTFSLHAFDVARRASKLVVADVARGAIVTDDGTVVFRRASAKPTHGADPRYLLMVMPPGKGAAALTKDDHTVGDIAFDPATSTIVYTAGDGVPNELWKVPLHGDQLTRLGSAYRVAGFSGGSAIVSGEHGIEAQPLAGGKPTRLDLGDFRVAGVHAGQLTLFGKTDHKVTLAPVAAPAKRTLLVLEFDRATTDEAGGQAYLFLTGKTGHEIHTIDQAATTRVLTVTGAGPIAAARVGDQLAVLAAVDSNNDGDFDSSDEADLCFIAPGPPTVAFPTRTVPRRLAEAAARLAELTRTGPLAGARLGFPGGLDIDLLRIDVAAAPPDLDLAALIRTTQDQVTRLSQLPHLSVALEMRDTGQRATSAWNSGAGTFLFRTGIGLAQLGDRTQYLIEVEPAVGVSSLLGNDFGDVTCSGTVKNISDHALTDLEVACSMPFLTESHYVRAKLRPARLAPNATTSYRLALGHLGVQPNDLEFFAGGKRIPFFNAYAQKLGERIIALATKLRDSTQLTLWTYRADVRYSPARQDLVNFFVRASRALEDGPAASLEAAAAKALPQLRAFVASDRRFRGTPQLLIVRSDDRIGWTYAGGKLTEGPPRT